MEEIRIIKDLSFMPIHRFLFCFSFFLSPLFFLQADYPIFTPPSGWEIGELKNPSPHVKIGFIGKGTGDFRPSINLAIEEVDVSLKEYLKAVKELQTAEKGVRWRDLGPFPMEGGIGRLTEISNSSPWGDLKILQAFFIAGKKAYILTAAMKKEDFSQFQPILLPSFRSLRVIEELWTPIEEDRTRIDFASFFSSLGVSGEKEEEWEELQRKVLSHSQLGLYWQFLVLREGREKIYHRSPAMEAKNGSRHSEERE